MKKRVAGLLLALMMALSLVTPAVAVETGEWGVCGLRPPRL